MEQCFCFCSKNNIICQKTKHQNKQYYNEYDEKSMSSCHVLMHDKQQIFILNDQLPDLTKKTKSKSGDDSFFLNNKSLAKSFNEYTTFPNATHFFQDQVISKLNSNNNCIDLSKRHIALQSIFYPRVEIHQLLPVIACTEHSKILGQPIDKIMQIDNYAVDKIMQISNDTLNIKGIICGMHARTFVERCMEIENILMNIIKFKKHCKESIFIAAIWNGPCCASATVKEIYQLMQQIQLINQLQLPAIFVSPCKKKIRRYFKRHTKIGRTKPCAFCYALTTKFCECKLVHYCDKKCQKRGWRSHKIICTAIKH